jgi:hypothetical protein
MKTVGWGAALLAAMTVTMTVAGTVMCAATDLRVERRYSPAVERYYSSGIEQFSYSWAAMPLLPRRLQNHCGYFNGHYVCADHCGTDYQVFYCGGLATGCCHVGRGYCEAGGALRCMPALF